MSDTPIVVDAEVSSDHGVDVLQTLAYMAPLDGTFDPFQEADMAMARQVIDVLNKHYPLYPWHVTSEIRQGFVAFQLPEIMGPTLNAFIRRAEMKTIEEKLIVRLAGDMLERMGLPRGRCDMDLYREAKERMDTFQFGDVKGSKR